jgi:glycosyltransferase involved in cell wall biosynthesis
MKIAFIGQKGIPANFGGVERHVHDLAVRLAGRGHSVTAYGRVLYTGSTAETYEGVRLRYTRGIRLKNLDTITHTFSAILDAIRRDFDIIHIHGVGPSLLAWIPRIFARNVVVITTFHSIDRKHEKWGSFAKFVLWVGEFATCRFSHRTIAVSKSIEQYIRDVFGEDSTYIPNAVELHEKEAGMDILDKYAIESGKYVLFVSRLIPHKGTHYLISAWQNVEDSKLVPSDIKLVIVGDGYYTDEYSTSLKSMVRKDDNIIFTGFESGRNLRELFSHAKLMVHPSDKEGLPITVLEAMSFSLPVLLSDIPEHLEIGVMNDYYFRRSDISHLTHKLGEILAKSEKSLKMSGNKNRKTIEKKYSWDSVISEIEKLYHQTLAENTKTENTSKTKVVVERF